MSTATGRQQQPPPRTLRRSGVTSNAEMISSRGARRSYHDNNHSYPPQEATLERDRRNPLTLQDALPERYLHSTVLTRTRLPDSEPIYHDIEEERQRSLSYKRQRSPRQTPPAAEKSMSPARQRVVTIASSASSTPVFRPLQEPHLPPEETEQEEEEIERVPSDIKDTWVIYGDAYESGSVITGVSRQELLRRRSDFSNDEIKRKKDKKYGKKKKKSLILNLPLGFTRRSEDWPKYSRGADELSNSASGVFRSGNRRSQLTERWARKGSRRFVSHSFSQSQTDSNSQHDKIPPITTRVSEDLTSAMSSQSPHMNIVDYDASMNGHDVDGQQNRDQMVEYWLTSDFSEQPMDRSIMSDDASFPYLSAPTPTPPPQRPSPPLFDSSVTQSSAAASDQAVADSTATLDDLRGQALERRINLNIFDFDENVVSREAGDGRFGKGEDQSTLATDATIGNDSPTSIMDMHRGNHSSHLQHSQPLPHYNHHYPTTRSISSNSYGQAAPKSILRRKTPRALFTDCPSDEGRVDQQMHPKQKTVRIVFDTDEDQVAKAPPLDGSFRDDDGRELSPIRPEKPALPTMSSSVAEGELTMQQVHVPSEMEQVYATPNGQWYGNNWPNNGWRESDPTKVELAQVREVDEISDAESEGYSCGFIEEVAAVVIQTAMRQFLAKQTVLRMLEYSLAHMRESHFNDMTFRMYNLAAIKIQSAFRGWWIRDSLSVDHYCATLIQKVFRGFLYRTNYYFDLYRIIVVQSIWRRNAARDAAVDRLACVIAIQAAYRGFAVRRSFEDAWGLAQHEVWAATTIQARWRGYDAQMNYLHTLADILVVQSIARVWITRRLIVPYLRAQKLAKSTEKANETAQLSRNVSTQRQSNTSERSSQHQVDRTSNSRNVGAVNFGGPQRHAVPKLKTQEEVESRSDGETGASEIISALRASEQQNPMAWKQLSVSTSTPRRMKGLAEKRHAHRVRLSTQHR